jgi:MGT family glycosyltransferase
MSTILFVGHPNAGHLNPLVSIAVRVRARGHRCVFAGFGPAAVLTPIGGAGLALEPLPSPLSALGFHLLPYLRGMVESAFAVALFTAQPVAYARRLLPLLRRLAPDAIVSDFLFPGGGIAAEVLGIPWISVYHAGLIYPGPGVHAVGSGLDVGAPPTLRSRLLQQVQDRLTASTAARLARARAVLRRAPAAVSTTAPWTSPWLTLVLTAADAEAPREPLPPCSFFIGPCLEGRVEEPFPFHLLEDRPRVFVSMGTVFNRRPRLLRRIVLALRPCGAQLIVAAGASFPHLRDLEEHALVFPRVPQLELLPQVDVVISHGGNNTVTESLAAGKPLLVLPQGGEQDANASRVTFLGAGLRANGHRIQPLEIRAAAARLIADPSFRGAAARVAATLARTDGPTTAARLIERVADRREPIHRPADYPATLEASTPLPWEWPAAAARS